MKSKLKGKELCIIDAINDHNFKLLMKARQKADRIVKVG